MNTEALAEYVRNANRLRELKAEQSQLNDRQRTLQETLLTEFEQLGMENTRIDGTTVYVHRQTWAKPAGGDHPTLAAALKELGMPELAKETVNSQTLSAYVRELESVDEPLPDRLKPLIEISEVFSLRTRRG